MPRTARARPAIVTWQYRYCGLMSVVHVLLTALGVFMIVNRNRSTSSEHSPEELLWTGLFLVPYGLSLSVAYGIAPFLGPASWLWKFHLVLILLSFTSCWSLPLGLALMIGWVKPETSAYFSDGMT